MPESHEPESHEPGPRDPGAGDTDWLDDHIELYAIAVATADETERVERELDALPPVQRSIYDARIAETRDAMSGYASSFALEPPAQLRDRTLDAVFAAPDARPPDAGPTDTRAPREDPASQNAGTVTPLRRPDRGRLVAALAAAAVVVAVALGAGVLIGRTTAPEPAPVALDESQRQVIDVLGAEDATVSVARLDDDRGTMSVVTSRASNQAVALLRDVGNPPGADETFQLWLVGKADSPVSAGLLAGTGIADPLLVDDLDASEVLAVTIEPAGGSEQPTTPILAQIQL